MAELDRAHIARPYANAAFSLALSQHALADWGAFLQALAHIGGDADAARVLRDPRISHTQKSEWVMALCDALALALDASMREAFIKVLAANRRLSLLPQLSEQFHQLKREHEQSILIHVKSAQPLSQVQQDKLTEVLKQRYHREIELSLDVDSQLLGGVVINAGDETIDGSLRGQCHRLLTRLTNPYQ